MSFVIEDVLVRHDPVGDSVPLVVDSPHSGRVYPGDFGFCCPLHILRQAEDTYVEELFGAAPDVGGILIEALFPRSYIDVNRAPDDIDPTMIDGVLPEPPNPSEKSAIGMGLIRKFCRPGMPMYDGRLTAAQVQERIERYWRPYHEALTAALDETVRSFGGVWHLNCHSMPSTPLDAEGPPRPDVVLGDRDGSTCEPEFVRFVAETMRAKGYSVAVNRPFKGVEILRRYGHPGQHRHSLQIELNRALYMNERTLEKSADFPRLADDVADLLAQVAGWARSRLQERAAAE